MQRLDPLSCQIFEVNIDSLRFIEPWCLTNAGWGFEAAKE